MRIIPVLDLQGGQVVRGVAGRRADYRPIVSRFTDSSVPLDVARMFRDQFGLTHVYLADLDAITGSAAALTTYAALRSDGFRLWVDAGVRDRTQLAPLVHVGVEGIVVGLETVTSPAALQAIVQTEHNGRIIFSLDLKEGQPLGNAPAWSAPDPWSIVEQAVSLGVGCLIVLDLARVGVGTGTGTEDLCRHVATAFPDVEIVAGGGVRDRMDLQRLQQCGVSGVLVASALHDGRFRREDLVTPPGTARADGPPPPAAAPDVQ